MASSDAPISIGSVTLVVNSLNKVAEFYRSVVGLNEISKEAGTCCLGQGDTILITLTEDKNARRYPQEAGLFHTAFLLPDRSALGAWYKFSHESNLTLNGAADHIVSEAVYLTDPEGNGVEIYADRDRSHWQLNNDGTIKLDTTQLRTNNLMQAARQDWTGAPNGTVVGHVHLQVGALQPADEFYVNELGFSATSSMESARFYGAGGYHHHLAGNIWHSHNAGVRSKDSTGLLEVELLVSEPNQTLQNTTDPWGNNFKVSNAVT